MPSNMLPEEPMCFEESRLDGNTKEQISVLAATVNNLNKTTLESSQPEGMQSISQNSTRMIGEDHFKGIPKPHIKHVYKRRGKKHQVTEAINKSQPNKLDKEMGPESSNATRIVSSTGNRVQSVCRNSSRMIGEDPFKGIPKPPIKYVFKRRGKKQQVTEAINKSPSNKLDKGVSMDHTGPGGGVLFHEKQYVSKMDTRLHQNSVDNGTYDSFSEMDLHENLLKDIRQFYLKIGKEELKLGKLYSLLKTVKAGNIIIFANTKDKVMSLIEDVGKHYTVSASHDDMHQHARDTAIQKFQSGSSSILIVTDLRDTNVVQVPIVINYDLPTQLMQYIRRVQQQNGLSGRKSVVINLVTPADECILFDIQRFCNRQMRELPSNVWDLLVGYGAQKQK